MYIDLIIKLKNAARADKKTLRTRYTNMDHAVSEVLLRYGFLKKIEVKGRAPKRTLELALSAERPIEDVRFLSTPSLRRYGGYKDFRTVKGGNGILIVSTPKGIKSGIEAKREKIGGQLLAEIW
jgi:small subunit ribosomal protein S8